MAQEGDRRRAGWGIRLAAVAATLLFIVVVFAVKFSAHGNETRAVMAAAMPVAAGVVAAFLVGLIKKLAASGWRWRAYLYVLVATSLYLIVVEFI